MNKLWVEVCANYEGNVRSCYRKVFVTFVRELVVNSVARSLFLVVWIHWIVNEIRKYQSLRIVTPLFTPDLRIVHGVNIDMQLRMRRYIANSDFVICAGSMRKLFAKYAQILSDSIAQCMRKVFQGGT